MGLVICFVLACVAGIVFGGRKALTQARKHEIGAATRTLGWSTLAACAFAFLGTIPTLGWPFRDKTVTVTETVTQTVTETVMVPVRVWRWFVIPKTEMRKEARAKEVEVSVPTEKTVHVFSFALLFSMGIVGLAGGGLYCFVMRMLWRWLG